MKTTKKKFRGFRIEAGLEKQLRLRSEATGMTATRILENALMRYFRNGMNEDLKETSEKIRSFNYALGQPRELQLLAA
jgi:hypothetical protein